MEEWNYYEILDVDEEASSQDIKMAYREQIKRYHPDTYRGDPEYAETQTRLLNEAYAVLSDPKQRSRYDRSVFSEGRRIVQEQIRRHGEEAAARLDAEDERKRQEAAMRREEMLRQQEEALRREKIDRYVKIGAVILLAAAVICLAAMQFLK